jgi:hypothetical protein
LKGARQAGVGDLEGFLVRDLKAVHKHLSTGGGQQPGNDVDQGGFPRAVRPD